MIVNMWFQCFFAGMFFLLLHQSVVSQTLVSGPMVGYSDFREVALWVQTDATARMRFDYWPKDKPELKSKSIEVQTLEANGYTAEIALTLLEPGTRYEYELRINGKRVKRPYPLEFQTQVLWQFRTDPPNFRFAAGSCTYVNDPQFDRPGKPYGHGNEIFRQIHAARPDFMLWLGDNTYLREVDVNSRSGIYYRYQHTRAIPEMQSLLGSASNYALWDDHDYGPNDSDRGYIRKRDTWDAFYDFWANPTQGLGEPYNGITTQFAWADCEFFLLDNRWFRSPNRRITGEKTILGEEQFQWLVDALKTSRANFKFVCIGGQVLNPAKAYETYANLCPEERLKLIEAIQSEAIEGVLFMDGDRHVTELSVLESPNFYPLYDLTVSPLTSGVPPPVAEQEANTLRVQGTFVREQNYALFEVSGPYEDRLLSISIFSATGELKWLREIRSTDLQLPKDRK